MYPLFCEDAIRLLRSRKMCRTYSEGAYYDLERYNRCGAYCQFYLLHFDSTVFGFQTKDMIYVLSDRYTQ